MAENDPKEKPEATENEENSIPVIKLNPVFQDLQKDEPRKFAIVQAWELLKLKPEILKGMYAMRAWRPSSIQGATLPIALADPPTNTIIQSHSGSGKTVIFVTTILNRIDTELQKPQALVVAPTRELAHQIVMVVQDLGRFFPNLQVFTAVPPANRSNPLTQFNARANVIVGTPGTVLKLINLNMVDCSSMRVFVLDEADHLLNSNLAGDVSRIASRIPREADKCQKLLTSATFPLDVENFTTKYAPTANFVRFGRGAAANITQMYMDCPNDKDVKFNALLGLYGCMTVGSSVVFVHSKKDASRLRSRMIDEGHHVEELHSDLDYAERDRVFRDFRVGNIKVIITTDVFARGIDVSTVSLVINFDVPMDKDHQPDVETYIHRIGRTGRFGRVGVSVTFVHDEESYRIFDTIAKELKLKLVRLVPEEPKETEVMIKRVIKEQEQSQMLTSEELSKQQLAVN